MKSKVDESEANNEKAFKRTIRNSSAARKDPNYYDVDQQGKGFPFYMRESRQITPAAEPPSYENDTSWAQFEVTDEQLKEAIDKLVDKIDIYSVSICPFIFLIFNALYWPYYFLL